MNGVVLERLLARGPALGAGEAAVVLRSVGRGLLARHADGTVHGAVGPAAVVIGRDGRVSLREPSLLSSSVPGVTADLQGFLRLARTLATAWCAGDRARAELLERCGAIAPASGLPLALETLRVRAPWCDGSRLAAVAAEISGPTPAITLPVPRSVEAVPAGERLDGRLSA
jgi:hypothetical protein